MKNWCWQIDRKERAIKHMFSSNVPLAKIQGDKIPHFWQWIYKKPVNVGTKLKGGDVEQVLES